MTLAVALWLILIFTSLGYLAGRGNGRRRGRFEMAATIEAKCGPLLKQLEEFSEAVAAYDVQPNDAAKKLVDQRIKAMREAGPWN